MSEALNRIVDYLDLIDYDQEAYYEIRDYLRENSSSKTREEIEWHLRDAYGDIYGEFTDELIDDVQDLLKAERQS